MIKRFILVILAVCLLGLFIGCAGSSTGGDEGITASPEAVSAEPETTPEPAPLPTTQPTPELTSQPTLEPTPEPTPQPTPEPAPEPTPDSTAEPAPEPAPETTPEPASEPTPDPSPQPTPQPEQETGSSGTDPAVREYVLNTNTMKFHYPSCSSVKDIKDKNRWDYTGTRDEILEMGYIPCKKCNP